VAVEFTLGLAIATLFNRRMVLKRLWMSFLIVPMVTTPGHCIPHLEAHAQHGVRPYLMRGLTFGAIKR
jgi:hypothetical protein